MLIRINHFYRSLRVLRVLRRDDRASTTIEFAMLAVPFIMWILGLMMFGLQTFILTMLDSATQAAARKMEVGSLPRSVAAVTTDICNTLQGMGGCSSSNLQIYAVSGASFNLTSASISGSTLTPSTFDAGTTNSFVLLQVAYVSPFALPGSLFPKFTMLSSAVYQNGPNVP